jgi:hypothetical protein
MEPLPDRTRNRIRELKSQVVQLEAAIDLIASVDTALLVRSDFAESMLREVANLLDHTRQLVIEQALEAPESDPQTLRPL